MTLYEVMRQAERKAIEDVLKATSGMGRIKRAAQALGITRKCLWEKMKKHAIDKTVVQPQERLAL